MEGCVLSSLVDDSLVDSGPGTAPVEDRAGERVVSREGEEGAAVVVVVGGGGAS
jgi:hypothetical protein